MDLETLIQVAQYVMNNYAQVLAGLDMIVGFLVGVFLFIPGPQPEQALKSFAAFLERYSKK